MMYNIGVTGTRYGMNDLQSNNIVRYLEDVKLFYKNVFLHHGNCIGVDTEIAHMADELGYKIICHPPEKTELTGTFDNNLEVRPPRTHFSRNRNIVTECDVLIVVPFQNSPQKIGGTWYTNDYAAKMNKPRMIFYPDGRVV